MNRIVFFATCMCGVLVLNVSAFASTIPAIQGQVYDMQSHSGIAGARIELYADDGNAVFDGGDAMVTSVATDANGSYAFGGLGTQSYFVVHDGSTSSLQTPGDIGYLIDEFEITQSVIADPLSVSRTDSISGPAASIIGGTRDLYLEIMGGSADGKLRANPFSLNSNLQLDMAAGVTGRGVVTWDGVPGTAGMDPDHGLNMDFTGGGLFEGIGVRLAVDAAGEGQMLTLLIHSGAGNVSSAQVEFPVDPDVDPKVSEYVLFSDFAGTADIENVTAFQLLVDAEVPSLDAQIDVIGLQGPSTVDFAVVPEPSALLLVLAGLVAALGYRGRRQ